LLQEQLKKRPRDRVAVALDLLENLQRAVERDTDSHDLLGDREQRRARNIVDAVPNWAQRAELLRASEHGGSVIGTHPEPSAELAERQRLGTLAARRRQRLLERQQALGRALLVLEQALDPVQVEPVVLELANQPQLCDVLGTVIADAHPDLRRVEQPARLVSPDVAYRQARLGRQLLDRQLVE